MSLLSSMEGGRSRAFSSQVLKRLQNGEILVEVNALMNSIDLKHVLREGLENVHVNNYTEEGHRRAHRTCRRDIS